MFYVFPLVIPANTPETAKLKTILPLAAGKVKRVNIEFPAGHCGLTHLHINRGLHQAWPTNPEANFSSSNETIAWDEDYILEGGVYQFEAYAWNVDDTYEHTITVRMQLEALPVTKNFIEEVRALLGLGGSAGL